MKCKATTLVFLVIFIVKSFIPLVSSAPVNTFTVDTQIHLTGSDTYIFLSSTIYCDSLSVSAGQAYFTNIYTGTNSPLPFLGITVTSGNVTLESVSNQELDFTVTGSGMSTVGILVPAIPENYVQTVTVNGVKYEEGVWAGVPLTFFMPLALSGVDAVEISWAETHPGGNIGPTNPPITTPLGQPVLSVTVSTWGLVSDYWMFLFQMQTVAHIRVLYGVVYASSANITVFINVTIPALNTTLEFTRYAVPNSLDTLDVAVPLSIMKPGTFGYHVSTTCYTGDWKTASVTSDGTVTVASSWVWWWMAVVSALVLIFCGFCAGLYLKLHKKKR